MTLSLYEEDLVSCGLLLQKATIAILKVLKDKAFAVTCISSIRQNLICKQDNDIS